MRYFVLILFLCSLLVGGCGEPNRSAGIDVTIIGADTFPAELAGTWKSNHGGWELTFSEDGEIVEIVHTLGRMPLQKGRKAVVEMRQDGEGIFEPGKWSVIYDGGIGFLTVKVPLEYFYAEMGDGIVEGNRMDMFSGTIPEDGQESWIVEWSYVIKAVARTPNHPEFDMSSDPDYPTVRPLVFERASE